MHTQQLNKAVMLSGKSVLIVFAAVFWIAFFGLIASCQQEGPAEKAGKKIDQAAETVGTKLDSAKASLADKTETAGLYLDDSAITAKIKAEVLSDPLLKSSQINVSTHNGVVSLSGVVDSKQSIDRAVEIARSNKTVKSVESSLAVNATQ